MRYWVNEVSDDLDMLQARLDELVEQGATVVSVTWRPAIPDKSPAGFIIVNETER